MAETKDPGLVREVMGHESLSTTMGYVHPETAAIKAVIDRRNQQKLKDFNHRYYTPENMVLVVVGPVQPKAVRAMVDQTFGKRPRTGYAPPPAPPQVCAARDTRACSRP